MYKCFASVLLLTACGGGGSSAIDAGGDASVRDSGSLDAGGDAGAPDASVADGGMRQCSPTFADWGRALVAERSFEFADVQYEMTVERVGDGEFDLLRPPNSG